MKTKQSALSCHQKYLPLINNIFICEILIAVKQRELLWNFTKKLYWGVKFTKLVWKMEILALYPEVIYLQI